MPTSLPRSSYALLLAVLLPSCALPSGPSEEPIGVDQQAIGPLYWCTALTPPAAQLGSADCDGDGLTNADEAALGTLVGDVDTDDDGIEDGWEVNGYTHAVGFVDYPALDCDPLHRDLLIEVDYHDYVNANGVHHSAQLSAAVRDKISDYFGALPISNPDGSQGIHVVLLDDEQLGEGNGIVDAAVPGVTPASFDCYVGAGVSGDHSTWTWPDETFRKLTLCLSGGGARGNGVIGGSSLKFEAGETNNLTVGDGDDWTETAQHTWYWMFLHELGHSLGLLHGGGVNANFKVNYPSVMNYKYDAALCQSPKTLLGTKIGYSRGLMPTLDACSLSEGNPFPGLSAADVCFLADGNAGAANTWAQPFAYGMTAAGVVKVDWDRDGIVDAAPVAAAISDAGTGACAGGGSVLVRDFDDMARIEQCMATPLLVQQGKTPIAGCP